MRDENSKWVWVRSGDSLGRIARRFRVSLRDLKEENALKGNLIVVGDRLRIPKKGNSRKSRTVVSKRPSSPSIKREPKTAGPVRVAKAEKPAKPKSEINKNIAPERATGSITDSPVQLSSLAGPSAPPKDGTSWLPKDLNALPDPPERGSRMRKEALRQVLAVRSSSSKKFGWVRIRENETIGHFSRWLRVSPRVIRRMNRIRSSRRVRLGKKIRIPFRRVSKKNFLEKRVSYHFGIEEKFHRKYSVSRTGRHKLKRGENVWDLVMRTYKIPLWLFRKYNSSKDLRRISVGEELIFPVLEPRSF
jgi:membrane-bound lytic murein transglycosylase D